MPIGAPARESYEIPFPVKTTSPTLLISGPPTSPNVSFNPGAASPVFAMTEYRTWADVR
jgi:hypothetical protein